MKLSLTRRINAFARLGHYLRQYTEFYYNNLLTGDFSDSSLVTFDKVVESASVVNPWFTLEYQMYGLTALAAMLKKEELQEWADGYNLAAQDVTPMKVCVVMAGNIPLVGFHDFLCVLMSGHIFMGKLSSNDTLLLPALADVLIQIEPGFNESISFTEGRLSGQDAVIATGSNNSFRYFDYYFRNYPRILRKNRNGIAVINGTESDAELEGLADDIFMYFGMGCRSVTKVFAPKGYDIRNLFKFFGKYEGIARHNKYRNNYDYYKSIYLVNSDDFYEVGLVLFKPDKGFHVSPVSVVYYEEYESLDDVKTLITEHLGDIQCVVSNSELPGSVVPFGYSQQPGLYDYADGVDVMAFLLSL